MDICSSLEIKMVFFYTDIARDNIHLDQQPYSDHASDNDLDPEEVFDVPDSMHVESGENNVSQHFFAINL